MQVRHPRERKAIALQTIADRAGSAIEGCLIFTSSVEKKTFNITKPKSYISVCRTDTKCVNLFFSSLDCKKLKTGY